MLMSCGIVSSQNYMGIPIENIGSIAIKSTKLLNYDSRAQIKDTIFITIRQWTYSSELDSYEANVVDYVKKSDMYYQINSKSKRYSPAEVDGIYTMLGISISPSDSYNGKLNYILKSALLYDTQNNLVDGGLTVYGGEPGDWTISE